MNSLFIHYKVLFGWLVVGYRTIIFMTFKAYLLLVELALNTKLIGIKSFYLFGSWTLTAQKMKVSIKDFFSKCDQIRRKSYNKRHLRTLDLSSKFEYIFICSICGGASHKISGKHDRKTLVHGLFENASFLKKITFSLFNIKKN